MTRADALASRARWAAALVREPRLRHQPLMWLGARTTVELGPRASLAVQPGFVSAGDLQLVVHGRLEVGARFFANRWCSLVAHDHVSIGDDVRFGERVSVHDEDHVVDPVDGDRAQYATAPVEIGNRVWVGAGAIIVRGVTIGDGTVVGAGSVVTRDLPGGVLAAGAPARVVRALREGTT